MKELEELMNNAKNEARRVEHLFYVSLKYTRTADVMKNVIERMLNAFSFAIEAMLEKAKENKQIESIPNAPRARSDLVLKLYPDDEEIKKYLDFYILLRNIKAASYTKREEYRRHVTMTSELSPGEFIEVNIDVLSEYLKTMHSFIEYVQNLL